MKTLLLSLAAAGLTVTTGFGQKVMLPVVDMAAQIPADAAVKVFKIEGNEVAVKSTLLKRIKLSEGAAVLSFFNQSDKKTAPDFTVRLFNAYGIQLASFRVRWEIDHLAPGQIKTDDAKFSPPNLDEALRFTNVALPTDWRKPVWVTINGSVF